MKLDTKRNITHQANQNWPNLGGVGPFLRLLTSTPKGNSLAAPESGQNVGGCLIGARVNSGGRKTGAVLCCINPTLK